MADQPTDFDYQARIADLERQLVHWRNYALNQGFDEHSLHHQIRELRKHAEEQHVYIEHLKSELAAFHETLSWRITKPVRVVRSTYDSLAGSR